MIPSQTTNISKMQSSIGNFGKNAFPTWYALTEKSHQCKHVP